MSRYILFFLVFLSFASEAYSQKTFFIASREFHWTRGAVPLLIQPRVVKQLADNKFVPCADSAKSEVVIQISSHSYFTGRTELYFFAMLDASVRIWSAADKKILYQNDLKRIRGGGTSLELADDRVYENAARIIADTLTGAMYFLSTGKYKPPARQADDLEVSCETDREIPANPIERKNTYVLIIANDAYSPVQMARAAADSFDFHSHDARAFREYALLTLGIPRENITLLYNCKAFDMYKEIIKLSSYSKGVDGKAELIFYYAGLGLLKEKTLEPYLVPVDIDAEDSKFNISVADLYKLISEEPSRRISILLETSFRIDALKPLKEKSKTQNIPLRFPNVPNNTFLMAAAKPGQKAHSDPQCGHSLFTMALLKKLKESKGTASMKDISESVTKDVHSDCLRLKLSEQTPQSLHGASLARDYQGRGL